MKYLEIEIEGECPVCGSTEGTLLYEVNSQNATRHFRLEKPSFLKYQELKDRIELLWGKTNCQIIRCKECDFTYAFPYVGGDEKFYTLSFERSGYPTWKFEFQKSYVAFKKLIADKKKDSKVLEIGAGDGAFLSTISPEFIQPQNVYATEYSDYGLNSLKNLGFNAINEDFRKLDEEKYRMQFDFIFMFQVLEHLDDLDHTFGSLNELAKPNAYLFIGVPNSERIQFNELNGGLLDMPPNHIGRWTKKTFQTLSSKFNWELYDYDVEKPDLEAELDQFSTYKYLRNSQKKYSLENLIETHKSRLVNNRFYSLKKFAKDYHKRKSNQLILNEFSRLGRTQWVLLRKGQISA